jgi:hypothetical protein
MQQSRALCEIAQGSVVVNQFLRHLETDIQINRIKQTPDAWIMGVHVRDALEKACCGAV